MLKNKKRNPYVNQLCFSISKTGKHQASLTLKLQAFLNCTAPEPITDDFLERLAEEQKTPGGKDERGSTTGARTSSARTLRYGCSTCWTLAWFWSRIWSRAAERAGLANSGIAGAAPRRPGSIRRKHQNPQQQRKCSPFRVLTLLVSLYHWVQQHLQGGRIIETGKYLHDGWIWEESFSSINSLKREQEIEMSTFAEDSRGPTLNRVSVQQYHRLGSNEGSQHASSRKARSTEGHPDVGPTQQPAIRESLRLLGHLNCGKLQHCEAPKTSILTLSQLRRRASQGCRHFSTNILKFDRI